MAQYWFGVNGFYALYDGMVPFMSSANSFADTLTYISWHVGKLVLCRTRSTHVLVAKREHVASVTHGGRRGIMGEREEPCVREWKAVECVTPNMDLKLEKLKPLPARADRS